MNEDDETKDSISDPEDISDNESVLSLDDLDESDLNESDTENPDNKSILFKIKDDNTESVNNNMPDNNEGFLLSVDDSSSDDDEEIDNYDIKSNSLLKLHPEMQSINYKELMLLSRIKKDKSGVIIDRYHNTLPVLSKYEKTRILGQRAKQLENGSKPLIVLDRKILDSKLIAELELKEKKIPFIIKRPIPDGTAEYWKLKDLLII